MTRSKTYFYLCICIEHTLRTVYGRRPSEDSDNTPTTVLHVCVEDNDHYHVVEHCGLVPRVDRQGKASYGLNNPEERKAIHHLDVKKSALEPLGLLGRLSKGLSLCRAASTLI